MLLLTRLGHRIQQMSAAAMERWLLDMKSADCSHYGWAMAKHSAGALLTILQVFDRSLVVVLGSSGTCPLESASAVRRRSTCVDRSDVPMVSGCSVERQAPQQACAGKWARIHHLTDAF